VRNRIILERMGLIDDNDGEFERALVPGYSFIRTNSRSGRCRMTTMIQRQNHGV
jgi:hypothetical protein